MFIKFSSMMYTIIFVMTFLLMLQSFLHKYCKQELLDLSLMVKMSLSNKRDMHDSLQLSWHLMFFKLFVVDFYLENPRWRIRDRFSVRTPEQYYPRQRGSRDLLGVAGAVHTSYVHPTLATPGSVRVFHFYIEVLIFKYIFSN